MSDAGTLGAPGAAGPRPVSHRLVWALACIPMLFAPFSIALQFIPFGNRTEYLIGFFVLNILSFVLMLRLMAMDRRHLRESGLDTAGLSLWYILFIPLWFYKRGSIAKKKGPGWVFLLCVVLSSGIAGAIGGARSGAEVARAQQALKAGRYQEAVESAERLRKMAPAVPPPQFPAPYLLRAAAQLGLAGQAARSSNARRTRATGTSAPSASALGAGCARRRGGTPSPRTVPGSGPRPARCG